MAVPPAARNPQQVVCHGVKWSEIEAVVRSDSGIGAEKLRVRLPYDGQGLRVPDDARIGRLRKRGAARFWRQVPRGLRGPAMATTRLASIAAAYWNVRAFA